MLASFWSDVRYCLRGFARRPLFAIVIVSTLAFGIGVNVAVLALFEQVLLRPLPVAEPDRLVNLVSPGPKPGRTSSNQAGTSDSVFSYPMFRDLERLEIPLAGIAGHVHVAANLGRDGHTTAGGAMLVSGRYFALLGLQPALGRLLDAHDDRSNGDASVVVLSHDYWRNELGGDPGVLGATLVVNGMPLTIVGVAPAGFSGTTLGVRPAVFVPITFRWSAQKFALPDFDDRRNYWVYLFARLAPGTTAAQVATELNPRYQALLRDIELPLQEGMSEIDRARFVARTIDLLPGSGGQTNARDFARTPLAILVIVATIVLLISCANLANLMLARGSARHGEMAMRTALGASPARLVRLLLIEASLLALVAMACGLPLARATQVGIEGLLPGFARGVFEFGIDRRTVAIAALLAALAVPLFGLLPVLGLTRAKPGRVLHAGSARSGGDKAAARFRTALATTQIALATMLLTLAGLFLQSLVNIHRIDLGLRTEAVVTFAVAPERNGYTAARAAAFYDRLEAELAALPGVAAAAASLVPLLAHSNWSGTIHIEGRTAAPDSDMNAQINFVGSDYFRVFDMPLLRGRAFTAADTRDRPKVAIVNQRFIDHHALGAMPLGRRIAFAGPEPDIEIVGVVRDAKYSDVKETIQPQVFMPRRQPEMVAAMSLYVRTTGDPASLLRAIPAVMARLDPNLPATGLMVLDQQVRDNVVLDRLVSTLAATLAALATLLATLGLYGVVAFAVAQRTREIGVRLALGAPPRRVRAMVLRQVARLTLAGAVLGLAAAFALGQVASKLLYGVAATDPRIALAACVTLALVAFGAAYLPARRAARIDPVVALRCD
ncbi:MAG: ABC transporter permease [Gammaproteobacteria bacterium]|nr:ABC transporter permease [Gammaproteobacteria bacterium]